MRQPCDHRINNQYQQHQAQAEEHIAEGSGNVPPTEPFITNSMVIQAAGGDEAIIPAFAFMEHFILGDAAGEDDRIHGEFFNPEMRVEKMNGEDESSRQQCLVRVDDKRYV